MPGMIQGADITAVILAGGAGRRLGGIDKGWLTVGGRSLVENLLAALEDRVAQVVISANTHRERYAALGHVVVADPPDAPGGPMAGVFACWPHVSTPYMLLLPVDAVVVPETLVQRLAAALRGNDADLARVQVGDDLHPTCALLDRSRVSRPSRAGGSLMGWQESYRCVSVPVDDSAVLSVNTPEEYAALAKLPG